MFRLIVLSAIFALASSAPAGPRTYHAPKPSYHPQPKSHDPQYEEPKPYHYAYGVSDEYTGTNFEATEDQA